MAKLFLNARGSRERGYVLLLTALSMVAIIPIIGMAMDVTLLFMIQTRMSAAVDAAALAAARSLSRGTGIDSQRDAAMATARAYFRANFPHGYLMTPNPGTDPSINVSASDMNMRTVTIDVTVQSPLYFLRMLSLPSSSVRAYGQASRRDVNVVLVLDRSGSLESAGACGPLKAAAIGFTDKFAEGRDNVGLVTFARSSTKNFPASINFKTGSPNITDLITAIVCSGYTAGPSGLNHAYEELQRLNQPGALNVIIFFTDGIPNTMAVDWPVKRDVTPYSPTAASTCDVSIGNTLRGVISPGSPTRGVYEITGNVNPPTDRGFIPSSQSTGCRFPAAENEVNKDVAYMPDNNIWGDRVDGYFGTPPTYTSGPYIGRFRVDNTAGVETAARNAQDRGALRIRSDATLRPVIYTIGLGDVGATQHDLLRRMANDPSASNYDSSKAAGLYVFAPTSSQLDWAFQRIASEILRLSL